MTIAFADLPPSRDRDCRESCCTSSASASRAGGTPELFDRQVDLIGDEEIEAEDVVRRFARRGGDRSTCRRAACSVPTPCRRRGPMRSAISAGEHRSRGGHWLPLSPGPSLPEPVPPRTVASARLLKIRLEHGVPAALRAAQDQLDELPDGAAASRRRAEPSAPRVLIFAGRVGRRRRQPDPASAPADRAGSSPMYATCSSASPRWSKNPAVRSRACLATSLVDERDAPDAAARCARRRRHPRRQEADRQARRRLRPTRWPFRP